LRAHPFLLLRLVLFRRHAAGGARTLPTSRRRISGICASRALVSAAPDVREAVLCDCRSVFLRAIQKKSRVPCRDWLPIAAPGFSSDLALALVVVHCHQPASREQSR